MIESAIGLVLRTRPLTETSLIIHWLTPSVGRIATAARGARRPKSPFRGKLDLFYLADFTFTRSRRSDLHQLREVGLKQSHPELRQDLARLRQAAYCAALIEQTTEPDTPLPAIFHLARTLLEHYATGPARPQLVFAFELKLLEQLGLQPDLQRRQLSPGAKQLASRLLAADWDAAANLRLSNPQTEELKKFLHGFLIFHLGKIPAGRSTALEP